MRWIGYVVLATLAIVAISFLSLVLTNAREGKNAVLESISIIGIIVTLTFVAASIIVDKAGYRF